MFCCSFLQVITRAKKKQKQNNKNQNQIKIEAAKRDLEVGKEAHVNNGNVVNCKGNKNLVCFLYISTCIETFSKFLNLVINLAHGLVFIWLFSRYLVVSIYIQVCSRSRLRLRLRLRDQKELWSPYNGESLCHASQKNCRLIIVRSLLTLLLLKEHLLLFFFFTQSANSAQSLKKNILRKMLPSTGCTC